MSFERSKTRKGFTLIELLIVIAIILILIAIALPNFMAARVRAVVTQVRGELRSLAMAVESYAIDHQAQYPILKNDVYRREASYMRGPVHAMHDLTTPIEYVSGEFIKKKDPFWTPFGDPLPNRATYHYVNREVFREKETPPLPRDRVHYLLHSRGPDKTTGPNPDGSGMSNAAYGKDAAPYYDPTFTAWQYSATNGSKSNGDLIRAQL